MGSDYINLNNKWYKCQYDNKGEYLMYKRKKLYTANTTIIHNIITQENTLKGVNNG